MLPEDIPGKGNQIDLAKVSFGDVPGYSSVRKFGERILAAAGTVYDIWNFTPATYTFSTTGVLHYISSDSAADTEVIEVQGLDANGLMQTIEVTLQGLAKTQIGTGEVFLRVFRAKNKGAALAGNVYIYEDDTVTLGVPDTDSLVRAYIAIGDEQTQMAIYTVPSDKKALAVQVTLSGVKKTAAVVSGTIHIREPGQTFRKVATLGINSSGTGFVSQDIPISDVLPGLTDIVVRAESDSVTTGSAATFSLILREA